MTMTDTEAKALALVNAVRGCEKWESVKEHDLVPAEALFAALDRHAAELREQAERFSEVAVRLKSMLVKGDLSEAFDALVPFILPAPDPLEDVLSEAGYAVFPDDLERVHAALAARGGKIVWGEGL